MPFQAKFTAELGTRPEDAVLAAGSDIAGSTDAIEVNIDATKMSRGDAVLLLEGIKQRILSGPWPLL